MIIPSPRRAPRRRRPSCRLPLVATAALVVLASVAVPPAPAAEPGVIETRAGASVSGDGPSRLAAPRTAAVEPDGDIFFTDTDNHLIRRLDPAGDVTVVAGNGAPSYSGDGGQATSAGIWRPHGVAVDGRGNVFIADSPNHRIRRVDLATGVITTVAGTGSGGFGGDGGPATAARLNRPRFLVVAPDGALVIADTDNRRVRRVDPDGIISTIAGTGVTGNSGDGGPATAARLDDPRGLALDAAGNLYVSNAEGSPRPAVRRVDPAGMITTVAGGNPAGFGGDGGPATAARLNEPRSIAVSGSDLYIADSLNHRIRRVDLGSGVIDTVAGTGKAGFGGDGGPARNARLAEPRGVAVTPAGSLVIADTGNNRIRVVTGPGDGGPVPLPPVASFAGRVTDTASQPTREAVIDVAGADGTVTSSVRPDAGGNFELGLDDGRHLVTARSPVGCDPMTAAPVEVEASEGSASPAAGTFVLEGGDGVPDAEHRSSVAVDPGDGRVVLETAAGDVSLAFENVRGDGRVRAACTRSGLRAGSYQLLDTPLDLAAEGFRYDAVTVCVPFSAAQEALVGGALSLVEGTSSIGTAVQNSSVCGRTAALSTVAVGFSAGSSAVPKPVEPRPEPGPDGYRIASATGEVFAFGQTFHGSARHLRLTRPIVGMADTATGRGYWLVASDGGIFTYGDAAFLGSTGAIRLNRPVVGMAPTPSGRGYWLVATDGGIFAFGDAAFFGSTGATPLNSPIVGMAATPTGLGYWLVASDGGIFAFGDAAFFGSTGATRLNRPIVGMAPSAAGTPGRRSPGSGHGYWLVASDGGIFTFGDAAFHGSTGATRLNSPIVGMRSSATGAGYHLVAGDGGLFTFGDAPFYGSAAGVTRSDTVVAIT